MAALVEFSRLYDAEIIGFLLTLPRIYACLIASQMLNTNAVPQMARTASVLSLALIVVPVNVELARHFDRTAAHFLAYTVKEIAIGFSIGYLIGWVQWAVQAAGGLIDNQRGAAIASSIDPLQGEEASPLGQMFSQVYLTYIFATGAFLQVVGLIYNSYLLWPTTSGMPVLDAKFGEIILRMFDYAMGTAILLAAPIVAIMFVAEFALAMVSRFAPQIQVFVIAMPIKSLLAMFVLVFYFATAIPYAQKQLFSTFPKVDWLYESFRAAERRAQPTPVTPAPSPAPAAPTTPPQEAPR